MLSGELKARLRRRGQELGVGHQTAAKMILAKEHGQTRRREVWILG